MSNQEAKQEAIKKAWVELIGESEHNVIAKYINDNGWLDFGYSDEEKQLCIKYNRMSKNNLLENDQFRFRPFNLSGIFLNNDWIRIEPDGSNLPTKNDFVRWYNIHNKLTDDLVIGNSKDFFLKTFTHYKPIIEDKPPIY